MEFSKRPSPTSQFNPHHVISPLPTHTLADCLKVSDVIISAVPSQSYKIATKGLKDGCVCVNVAGEKNFETDVRDRVSVAKLEECADEEASIYVPSVGVMTIAMLQRNL